MHAHESNLHNRIAEARVRHAESMEALEKVRDLLSKADTRCSQEPADARKWHRVLENLEENLDDSKKRVELAAMELLRLEQALEDYQPLRTNSSEAAAADDTAQQASGNVSNQNMNLEEKSRIQGQITSGEIQDKQVEARLELANQLGDTYDENAAGHVSRRQLALRMAIDKISQRQFNTMTHEEVKLVLACHTLLTSRLEPTGRDQRLKRILDGAVKILQRRNAELEGG